MHNRWQWRQPRPSAAMGRRRRYGECRHATPQYATPRGIAHGVELAPRAWCGCSGGSGERPSPAGGQ